MITCLQGVGASVFGMYMINWDQVQTCSNYFFFASIVYNICLGKYLGSEAVKRV